MSRIAAALFLAGSIAAAGARSGESAGEARAGLRVENAEDAVILTDGTKLVGTILAAGLRAVIIIEKGQSTERVIRRAEVESFSYASQGSGVVKGYAIGVNPDEGLPVIVGEGSAADSGPAAPAPLPAPKPAPGPGPAKPLPGPAKTGDLGKLWELLGGRTGADEIRAALAANPQWRAEIGRLLATGQVPPEGAEAVARFKVRLVQEPELRKLLDELMKQNKLPRNPEGVRKGQ